MANHLPQLIPPAPVIEIARSSMGAIDLDLYSTAQVNHVVQAARYLDRDDDVDICVGRHWSPGGGKRALLAVPNGLRRGRALANKLLAEYQGGHIAQAVLWIGANEILTSCPWIWDFPLCLPFKRLAPQFWDDELEQTVRILPADWSAVVYLPPAAPSGAFREGLARFHAAASPYGRVVLDEWSGESRWRESYLASLGKPYRFHQQ